MPAAPAKLQFVKNTLSSKILWTQIVTVIAAVLTAQGVHVLDDPATQALVITAIDGIVTAGLRMWSSGGPVSITAPMTAPPAQDVPMGASVVSVPAPKDLIQAPAVLPLDAGAHIVEVGTPRAIADLATAAPVAVTPVP